MFKTKISTFDSTWNPVVGCLHGCEYCYARDIAHRFGFHASEPDINERVLLECPVSAGKKVPYPFDFQPTFHLYRLNDYIGKKGRNIFVCSMADLFGRWVPDEWIEEVFETCEKAPQHNYLFLTKNYRRYREFSVPRKENMWYGMSVTTEKELGKTWMLPEYCHTFISIEPILKDFNIVNGDLRLSDLEWVIIGAETGRRKNKVVPERKWIEDIVVECKNNEIPIFMKASLADIWGEPLIQEFPEGLEREES